MKHCPKHIKFSFHFEQPGNYAVWKQKQKAGFFHIYLKVKIYFLDFQNTDWKQVVTWATADSVFVQNICRLTEILQYKDVGKFQYSHSAPQSRKYLITFMNNVLSVCNYQPNIFKTHFGLTISAVLKIVIWLAVCEHAETHDFSQMTI